MCSKSHGTMKYTLIKSDYTICTHSMFFLHLKI